MSARRKNLDLTEKSPKLPQREARAAEQIEASLRVFSEVNEQTTAGVREIADSSSLLLERAQRLESEIARFRTKQRE